MLPSQTLTAVVSGREITLNSVGRPAVLIFHGQDTAAAAIEINNIVREKYPSAAEVLVASVIDLRQFPSMFHAMVRPELEKAYHKSAGKLPAGAAPEDLIVLLPDWKGAAHDACDIKDSTREAAVIVSDAEGKILCTQQGTDLATATLTALQNL